MIFLAICGGNFMKRFVVGADRGQATLLPECLDDFIDEGNPVRVIDAFVDALDLAELGFDGVEPAATGRPPYHPSVLVKLYIYGYLNRVQSSGRLEREAVIHLSAPARSRTRNNFRFHAMIDASSRSVEIAIHTRRPSHSAPTSGLENTLA